MFRLYKFIADVFEVYLGALMFAILMTSVAIQVFMRYVLNMPSPELFEISIYAFVWVIYLGGALAVRYNQHIRFDLIYRNLKHRTRLVLETVFNILTNTVLLILVVPSFLYTLEVYPIKASALRIPWTFLLLVYPIFLVLVLLHNFRFLYLDIREIRGGAGRPVEVFPWI